jgi:hypothetical protein
MKGTGFLVLIDITGYTYFLTQVDLEEGEVILRDLMETLVKNVQSPLQVAKLEGDAIFAYAPDGSFMQGQTLLEALENIYKAFRIMQHELLLNRQCSVQAYDLLPTLDIKMTVHHGEYIQSNIGGRDELSGPDVILAHRLLKNSIIDSTGIQAYVFFTDAAAEIMQMGGLADGMLRHIEHYDHLGDIAGYIHDLHPMWVGFKAKRQVYVTPEESWFDMETELNIPAALAWDYVNEPESKRRWAQADELTVEGMDNGRLDVGVEQYCRHGDQINIHRIVDWRPMQYVTYDIQGPLNLTIRYTIELDSTPTSTRIVWRFAYPTVDNPFHKVVAGVMSPFIQGFLKGSTRQASVVIHERAEAEDAAFVTPKILDESLHEMFKSTSVRVVDQS